jgi:hypothetical protein
MGIKLGIPLWCWLKRFGRTGQEEHTARMTETENKFIQNFGWQNSLKILYGIIRFDGKENTYYNGSRGVRT